MVINKLCLSLVGLLVFVHPSSAQADGGSLPPAKHNGKNLVLIPNNYNAPTENTQPFILIKDNHEAPSLLIERTVSRSSFNTQSQSPSKSAEDMGDQILAMVPHGDKMKQAWNIIDGDVDLYVEDLRFNRKNTGVTYKTNFVPFMGEVKGVELKFDVGEENAFSFESDIVPFVGQLDGFKFSGKAGDEDSRIGMRYTFALD